MDSQDVYAYYIDLINATAISLLTSLYDQRIPIDEFPYDNVLERYLQQCWAASKSASTKYVSI